MFEHVESTKVSSETCRRELFSETNNQGEQRFVLFEHVESTKISGETCRRDLFSEKIFRENRGSFCLNMFRVQRFLMKHVEETCL